MKPPAAAVWVSTGRLSCSQPEEQPAGGRLPVGQGAGRRRRARRRCRRIQKSASRAGWRPAASELLEHQPLAEAVAVQVGRLFEAHQRGEQLWRRCQEAQPQARARLLENEPW